jgi:hypothetical protein
MIRALETAIEKVKALPEERQRYLAEVLEVLAGTENDVYPLSDEEERLVQEGLDQLDRGEHATEAEVRAVFDKYRG